MRTAEELTIRKGVVVPLPVERAFELFTARIGEWWPLATHSIAGDGADGAFIEQRVGGRVYERSRTGDEALWATVTAWEPPRRFALDWKVNPRKPGTEVEVRFSPEGDGTRVELEHRGWERFGDAAETEQPSYDSGWDHVLGRFVEIARA